MLDDEGLAVFKEPEAVERARLLAACDACRTYLEQFRQTIRALGRLPQEALSPEAQRTLLDAFRGWSRR